MDDKLQNDIKEDEIRILGKEPEVKFFKEDVVEKKSHNWLWLLLIILAILFLAVYLLWPRSTKEIEVAEEQPVESITYEAPLSHETAVAEKPYTEIRDTMVNDINLRLFFPHAAKASLAVGAPDKSDSSIILIAQAADIRGDNEGIAGSFIKEGEVLAKGNAKEGFCAIIDGEITVGANKNSGLFEQAIEENGYFFRQFSLVKNGKLVEDNARGKSIRRALCQRGNEVFVAESQSRESFYDFSQALADIGMDNAIYLVGSNAYGWAVDKDGNRHIIGDENRSDIGKYRNINYIIWR